MRDCQGPSDRRVEKPRWGLCEDQKPGLQPQLTGGVPVLWEPLLLGKVQGRSKQIGGGGCKRTVPWHLRGDGGSCGTLPRPLLSQQAKATGQFTPQRPRVCSKEQASG